MPAPPARHIASGGLADRYHSIALDDKQTEDLREAAARYALAEAELREEQGEAALSLAQEAVELFRGLPHPAGAVDSVRIAVQAHLLLNQREEAESLLEEELQAAREEQDDSAEAKMLLTMAEMAGGKRNVQKQEEEQSLKGCTRALATFRAQQDKRMEAAALVQLAVLKLKGKEGQEQQGQDVEGLVNEALGLFRELSDNGGTAMALHWQAVVFASRGQLQGALAAADEARTLFKECGNRALEAREYQVIASWCLEAGAVNLAMPAAEEALYLFRSHQCGGDVRETNALQTLVRCCIAAGHADQALGLSIDAAERHKEQGNQRAEADAWLLTSQGYINLAKEYAPPEDPDNYRVPDEAIEAAEKALELVRDLGEDDGEARIATLISNLQLRRKDFEKASYSAQEALWMFEDVKDPDAHAAALQALMSSHLAKREYKDAVQTAVETSEVFKNAGDLKREAQSHLTVAEIHFAKKSINEAVAAAREAQSLFHEAGDRRGEGKALEYIAELRHTNGEAERALFAADRARIHMQRLGDKDTEARMLLIAVQNRILSLQKKKEADPRSMPGWEDLARATRDSKELAALCRELGDKQLEGCALSAGAQVLAFNLQYDEAIEAADQAISLFVVVGDALNEGSARILCAKLYLLTGDLKKALEEAREAQQLFQEQKDLDGQKMAAEILNQLREFEFRVDGGGGPAYTGAASLEDAASKVASAGGAGQAKADKKKIMSTLQEQASKMLGNEDTIDADMPLFDIGINSMNAVLFRNKLLDAFEGVRLPVTLIFDAPTLGQMGELLMDSM